MDDPQKDPDRIPQHARIKGSVTKVNVDENLGHRISHAIITFICFNRKEPAASKVVKNTT